MKFGDIICLLLSILVVVAGVYFFNEFRTRNSRQTAAERMQKTVGRFEDPAMRARRHLQRGHNPQFGTIPRSDNPRESGFIAEQQLTPGEAARRLKRQAAAVPQVAAPVQHPCFSLLGNVGLTAIRDGWKHAHLSSRQGFIY